MNPEVQQEIQQLKSEVETLKNNYNQIFSLINHLKDAPTELGKDLSPATRDSIDKVRRDNSKQVSVVVGATFTLLPQSEYIKVSGTASRTSSTTLAIANGTWYGQKIYIEGTDNTNTIVFKDAANTQLAGDCTLGIYDTLTVMWNGTYWIEIARSNN